MKSKIQKELNFLKNLETISPFVQILINQLDTLLLFEDDVIANFYQLHQECYIISKGLSFIKEKEELDEKYEKTRLIADYLYTQLTYLLY